MPGVTLRFDPLPPLGKLVLTRSRAALDPQPLVHGERRAALAAEPDPRRRPPRPRRAQVRCRPERPVRAGDEAQSELLNRDIRDRAKPRRELVGLRVHTDRTDEIDGDLA